MNPRLYVSIIDGMIVVIFFVVNPLIVASIAYSAWKGRPNTWDSPRYGVWAIVMFLSGLVLLFCVKLINADVRTWPYAVQVFCMLVGLLLLGISCGCGAGVFTYRPKNQGHSTPERTQTKLPTGSKEG